MGRSRWAELLVGLFVLAGLLSLLLLAFKVSGLAGYRSENVYKVVAEFDDIGGLKIRSRVSMAGVRIGEITDIQLNRKNYKAKVTMDIFTSIHDIPVDSSATILTEGLLGANYVNIVPGFENVFLKDGDTIEETHSALILENLIGQFLVNSSKDKKE